jgi:hypothetical protein
MFGPTHHQLLSHRHPLHLFHPHDHAMDDDHPRNEPVENLATFHPHTFFSDLLLVQSDSVTCAQDEVRFVVVLVQ